MLIKQTIEFELRGPRSFGCMCTLKPGYFHEKYPKANFRVNYYLLLKILL